MDITPPHLRCGLGQCPSVHYLKDGDYTPEHLKCAVSMACPGVRGHNGKLVIVGRKADDIATELGLGVGPDEAVIAIGEEYFSDLPELVRLREENERLREALGCQAEVTAVGEHSSNTACSLQTGMSAEAVEAIVTGVMNECSVNMHKCFATGKDDMAEAFRLRLEGAARVAQKLGMLRQFEEPEQREGDEPDPQVETLA